MRARLCCCCFDVGLWLPHEYFDWSAVLVGGDDIGSVGECNRGAAFQGWQQLDKSSADVVYAAACVWLIAGEAHQSPFVGCHGERAVICHCGCARCADVDGVGRFG